MLAIVLYVLLYRSKQINKQKKMDFITAFNKEFGTQAQLWEKHGLTRIYTNDRKLPAYFEVKNNVVQSHPAASAEMKAFIKANTNLKVCTIAVEPKSQSFREHMLSTASKAAPKQYRNTLKEYCFGAADEESY